MNKSLRVLLDVVGIGSILFLVVLSYRNSLWVDSAVLLVEMERIAEGFVPYKTMHLNYPPLWFYMMAGLKKLFGVPYGAASFYLTVHFLFSIGCAYFVHSISIKFGARRWASLLSVWIMLITGFWMYGERVMLEVPSMFFGLLSLLLILKQKDRGALHFLYAGFISACSFLVKQYGAGFCLLGLLTIVLFCDRNRLARISLFLSGYLIPLLVCFIIWRHSIVDSLLFNGYGSDSFRELLIVDSSSSIGRIAHAGLFIALRLPVICLSLTGCVLFIRNGKWKEALLCFCGTIGFLFSFHFNVLPNNYLGEERFHYFLYSLPFVSVLTAVFLSLPKSRLFCCLTLVVMALECSYAIYKDIRFVVMRSWSDEELQQQLSSTESLRDVIKEGETLWIVNCEYSYLYYFGNFYPADMKNFAYSTGSFEVTPEKAYREARCVDYVLLRKDMAEERLSYFDDGLYCYVTENPPVYEDVNAGFEIYRVKR